MDGWSLKFSFGFIVPQARVMATIGVTRGLGDHDLKVFSSNIHIKPFLSCFPEVSLAAGHSAPRGSCNGQRWLG